MNKQEAMSYGVREDAYKAFQEHCNRDARKMAARMVEEAKGRETAPAAPFPAEIRRAISSMLQLIQDPSRLSLILANVNRHYQLYQNEQTRSKANAQNPPETPARGLEDVPED